MKKNLVNKKIISSIGIGIMAFITATSPTLTVFAEEAGPEEVPAPEPVEQQPEVAETQSTPQNEAVSNAIDNAQDTIDAAGWPENDSAVPDAIKENLSGSSDGLEAIGDRVDTLDEYNQAAETAKKELAEVTEEDENRDNANKTSSEAAEKTGEIAESIEKENLAEAEARKDAIETAQGITYENKAAAEAAKEQAASDVVAAEEELAKAEEAKEIADRHVSDAETAYNYLQGQCDKAKEALEAAQAKADLAQEELKDICEAYGIDITWGEESFKITNIKGEAAKAYYKAYDAWKLAQADLEAAERKVTETQKAQAQAQINKETAEGEKADADAAFDAAKSDLAEKKEIEVEALAEWISAQTTESEKKGAFDRADTAYTEAQKEADGAAIRETEARENLGRKQETLKTREDELEAAEKEKEEAVKAYNDVSHLEPVFEGVREWQNKYNEEFADQDFGDVCWGIFNGMTKEVVKFYLYNEGINNGKTIDNIEFPYNSDTNWYNDPNDTVQNYLLVQYTENGEVKTAYFDYDASQSGIGSENSIYKISLYKKTMNSSGRFEDKGEEVVRAQDYADAVEAYLEKVERKEAAIQAERTAIDAKEVAEREKVEAEVSLKQAECDAKEARELAEAKLELKNQAKAAWDEAMKTSADKKSAHDDAAENVKAAQDIHDGCEKEVGRLAGILADAVKTLNECIKDANDALGEEATAKDIDAAVKAALEEVTKAVKKLAGLSAQEDVDTAAYEKLMGECEAAKKNWDDAVDAGILSEENLEKVLQAVEKAREVAARDFAYRTPAAPTTGGTGGTGGGTGGTGGGAGGTGGGAADMAVPVVAVPTAAVPVAGTGIVTVEDEATPLAGPEENEGLTTLEDETTPLAGPASLANVALPVAGPVAKMGQMSWWWLLIVALLGVTGEEVYRKHQKKQREQADIEN